MIKKSVDMFEHILDEIKKCIEREDKTTIIAIDGKCGSGKTTLGGYLHELFDSNLFHMDDFFLQSYQRTEERLSEIGGNVDYERFKEEVLKPIQKQQKVLYQPYHCFQGKLQDAVEIPYKKLNIVEGVYSLHPYFENPYEIKIVLDISEDDQIANIARREGKDKLDRFVKEWIPKENAYFEKYNIKQGCIPIKWEVLKEVI